MMQPVTVQLLALAVVVGLFLIFREIVLWYWKINRIIGLLESIDQSFKRLAASPQNLGEPPA